MPKILEATADATGKVFVDGTEVPDAVILGEGKQASTGLLFLDDDLVRYIPATALDLKTTIEKSIDAIEDVGQALTTIANELTAIGAKMTGPTTSPPPTLPTSVTQILAKVTELTTTRTSLTALKGALK